MRASGGEATPPTGGLGSVVTFVWPCARHEPAAVTIAIRQREAKCAAPCWPELRSLGLTPKLRAKKSSRSVRLHPLILRFPELASRCRIVIAPHSVLILAKYRSASSDPLLLARCPAGPLMRVVASFDMHNTWDAL